MPSKVEIPADTLRELYYQENQSLAEIAVRFDCSKGTVYKRMEEHGIPRRTAKQDIERIEVECRNCGKAKSVKQSHYRKSDRFFCDNECQGEFIEREGLSRKENNPQWKGKITVNCANCDEELEVYPCRLDEKDNHLCDNECRAEWYSANLSGEQHPLWKENGEDYYNGSWLRVKETVRRRDGDYCQLCGAGRDEFNQVPDVHHIRPIRDFDRPEQAHYPDNLVQLCRQCHGSLEQIPVHRQHEMLRTVEGGPHSSDS